MGKWDNIFLSPKMLTHFKKNVFWLESIESLTVDDVYVREPFAISNLFPIFFILFFGIALF